MTQGPLCAVVSPALSGFMGGLGVWPTLEPAPPGAGRSAATLAPAERMRVGSRAQLVDVSQLREGGSMGRSSRAPP